MWDGIAIGRLVSCEDRGAAGGVAGFFKWGGGNDGFVHEVLGYS